MIPVWAWLAELALESLGVILSFKRRNWLLFVFFTFCAVSDLAGFYILHHFSSYILAWSHWGQMAGKDFLLTVIACQICAQYVREHDIRQQTLVTAIVAWMGAAVTVWAFSQGSTIQDRLLDAEMGANIFLMVIVAIGWLGQKKSLSESWNWIAAGFILQIGGAIVITGLWMFWDDAKHLYALTVIPAYGIWLWAMIRRERLPECRRDMPNAVIARAESEFDDSVWLKEMGIAG